MRITISDEHLDLAIAWATLPVGGLNPSRWARLVLCSLRSTRFLICAFVTTGATRPAEMDDNGQTRVDLVEASTIADLDQRLVFAASKTRWTLLS